MMKRIISVLMVLVLAGMMGVFMGCEEDEVKVHRQSEVTTEKKTMEVTP